MASDLPELSTPRLVLKNISLIDTDDIVSWRSDPNVFRFFLNPHPISSEEHVNWFKNRYLYDDNRCDWMAFDTKGKRVGVFGIRRADSVSTQVEISYILAPECRGLGYAGEAVLRIIEYAAEFWNIDSIIAEIHVDNVPSIRFAENLGLKLTSKSGMFCVYANQVSSIKQSK